MKYKIGRYLYKELSEKQFNELPDEKELDTYILIDNFGDPIKFFIRINKLNRSKK